MKIDERMEVAAKLPMIIIEGSMPKSMLVDLKKFGDYLSIHWGGLLIGIQQSLEYTVFFFQVQVEGTDNSWAFNSYAQCH